MTQEERQLLLKDLCARLPYGVKCEAIDKNARFFIAGKYEYIEEVVKNIGTLNSKESTIDGDLFGLRNIQHSTQNKYYVSPVLWRIEDIKPYLRPISSMTDGEIDKLFDILNINEDNETEWLKVNDIGIIRLFTQEGKEFYEIAEAIDYLYSIHVDFRGLLKKGLAIEVTEENNPYK